jgi:chromosome segregation ATPase
MADNNNWEVPMSRKKKAQKAENLKHNQEEKEQRLREILPQLIELYNEAKVKTTENEREHLIKKLEEIGHNVSKYKRWEQEIKQQIKQQKEKNIKNKEEAERKKAELQKMYNEIYKYYGNMTRYQIDDARNYLNSGFSEIHTSYNGSDNYVYRYV